jgi:hypothetical protein
MDRHLEAFRRKFLDELFDRAFQIFSGEIGIDHFSDRQFLPQTMRIHEALKYDEVGRLES